MAYSDILYAVKGGVATMTLNRPDRLNAWTGTMHAELKHAMRAATDDDAARVIVLTGAGRGFCAGADMNVLQDVQAGDTDATRVEPPFDPAAGEDFGKTYSYFPAVPKPILAAINGPCAGLGLVIALYADLLYSARRFTALEAKEMGMVNRVIPHQSFEAEVAAYAHMLASEVSPRSLREMKRELWNAQFQSLGQAIDAANADMAASFTSEDFKEGVAHYLEKRAPAFTGR